MTLTAQVYALYRDGWYYPGTVECVEPSSGLLEVLFDDGACARGGSGVGGRRSTVFKSKGGTVFKSNASGFWQSRKAWCPKALSFGLVLRSALC